MIEKPKISYSFKIWMLIYISLATFYRLIKALYFPEVPIVSDQVIMGTVLFSLVYVWLREVLDRQILQQTNIKLVQAHERLKQANVNTMSSLILSVEAKDEYTSGHSQRVMEYSLEIGKKMKFSESELATLRNACLLHDVGKIGIPDSILHKVEKLTEEEWAVIKRHPQSGVEILSPLDFLEKEKLLILHHHERFNGTGYPEGLKGEDIPEGSRIMALADAYDAMKSNRPYRAPLITYAIIQEILKNSGTQFDPKIVNIFLELIEEWHQI